MFLVFTSLSEVIFIDSVHSFSRYVKLNWSSHFVHAKTGNGVKKQVVLRHKVFHYNLQIGEKRVFEQKFAFSLVVFCSHAAISL